MCTHHILNKIKGKNSYRGTFKPIMEQKRHIVTILTFWWPKPFCHLRTGTMDLVCQYCVHAAITFENWAVSSQKWNILLTCYFCSENDIMRPNLSIWRFHFIYSCSKRLLVHITTLRKPLMGKLGPIANNGTEMFHYWQFQGPERSYEFQTKTIVLQIS
jgi:hypothetical protein